MHDAVQRVPNYIIQTFLLTPTYRLNEQEITVDFFKEAVKPCDHFSALKSNNYLPYVMAAVWAGEKKLDDAILLNPYGNVADATIANVFIVKDGYIKTPPITDGCVNGVMRKHLLNCFKGDGIPFNEASISADDVLAASEVFLTNAIFGIKWVGEIGSNSYTSQMSAYLHKKFLSSLLL